MYCNFLDGEMTSFFPQNGKYSPANGFPNHGIAL